MPGESIIRSCAEAVFGNAITSRIFSVPQRIMQVLSMPAAKPPCGGVPYSSASRKKPNCERALSGDIPRALKFRCLDVLLVDTDRTAGAFVAIDHGIIRLCPDLAEQMVLRRVVHRRLEHLKVLIHRRCERMVCGDVGVGLVVVLEHREFGDDQAFVTAPVNQVLATCDLISQARRERCGNYALFAGNYQDGIALFGSGDCGEFADLRCAQSP
jgi:hypothetical protein